ncbi:MAG: cycH [Rhodospirillales bacterium]|nr:cycH [Rhodospirillales bacterium]
MIGFWIVAALLTAGVVTLLARPLMRKSASTDLGGGTDLAVYRDQLAELERERARGLVEAEQAASMETEIGRRMLNAAREMQPVQTTVAPSRALTGIIAVLFPIAGLAIYLIVGQPDLAGMPLATRDVAQGQNPAKILAAVEEIRGRLKPIKDDLDRWVMVAEAYEKLGRPKEAVATFRTALQISPDDPGLRAALGEALIAADGGAVGEEAKKLFQSIPPDSDSTPEARYYLALAAAQAGDMKTALRGWQSLLADSPADASWIGPTRERIASAAQAMGLDPAKEMPEPKPATQRDDVPLEGGPETAEGHAIEQMAPDQQQQMIEGMVAKLAARLEANPDDAEGWRRLARAYEVMHQPGKAKNALDRAAAAEAKVAGAPAPAAPATTAPAASAPEGGPNSAAGQVIQQMSPNEQAEMIQGMVTKLATKLEANPNDADGWRKLARAYQVLGQADKAKNALDRAAAADAKAAKP